MAGGDDAVSQGLLKKDVLMHDPSREKDANAGKSGQQQANTDKAMELARKDAEVKQAEQGEQGEQQNNAQPTPKEDSENAAAALEEPKLATAGTGDGDSAMERAAKDALDRAEELIDTARQQLGGEQAGGAHVNQQG